MYERGPLSRNLAEFIARSVDTYLAQADDFDVEVASYQPSGAFKLDLDELSNVAPDMRAVREGLRATVLETVQMVRAHIIDHVRALQNDMLRDPVPIWSTLTLSRAALESTALLCHLLDASVSPDTRLCRMAAQWLAESVNARTAARTFGAEHADDVDKYHNFKVSELTRGGFAIDYDKKQQPVRVRLNRAYAPLKLNITDEAMKILPKGSPSTYRLGSGAAHGRPWLLERSATKTDSEFIGEGSTAGAAALTVMFCLNAYTTSWGGYFGLDVKSQIDSMRQTMGSFLEEAKTLSE